jgi:hypothetical protein
MIASAEGCNLFEKNERLLAEHIKSNKEKISVYYVQLGATTNDVIQVRINKSNKTERLIKAFEKNYLQSSKLTSDTSLELILNDTGYHNYNNKADTLIVNVK